MTTGRPAQAGLLSLSISGREVPVTVIPSARRQRTVSFSVKGGAVVVRSPKRMPEDFIWSLLDRRKVWIERQLAAAHARPALEAGAALPFLGGVLRLDVEASRDRQRCAVKRIDDALIVRIPENEDAQVAEATVRRAVSGWYRSEAARLLPQLAETLAGDTGLQPSRVLVRTQRTRWGSCAADGTVRLSWRLVMLPTELAEYVILHELTHLRHPHHREEFWRALEAVAPGARATARRLRAFARALPDI